MRSRSNDNSRSELRMTDGTGHRVGVNMVSGRRKRQDFAETITQLPAMRSSERF